jgi:rubredoxin
MPTIWIHWKGKQPFKNNSSQREGIRSSTFGCLFAFLTYGKRSNTEMTTICPECGSERISERHIGRVVGGIAGGVAGALSGAGTGAAIGSVVPIIGTATGAIIGTLLGRFVAGASAGAVTGSAMDGVLFDRFECRNCEHTFD